MIKSRRMRWALQAANIGEMGKEYKFSAGKAEDQKSVEPRQAYGGIILKCSLQS
jgi:hypothetical protein